MRKHMQQAARQWGRAGGWAWRGTLVAVLVVMLAEVLAGPVQPTQAQTEPSPSPVTLEVRAGYNGAYRANQWFPITVTASNDGPDLRGVLEWRFPGEVDSETFRRAIDLPRGSRKQFTFYAAPRGFARSGTLRLLVEDQQVSRVTVRIEPVDASQFMIGVLSSDAALLNSLTTVTLPDTGGTNVHTLVLDELPDNAVGLSGLDAIFVHDVATANLSPAQRAALEQWVQLGGQLVIGGGGNAEQTTAGLVDLLPVQLGGLRADTSLEGLAQLTRRRNQEAPPSTTVNEVTLLPGARALAPGQLITVRDLGVGRVIFSAFDLAVLRAWQGEPALWRQVLQVMPRFDLAAALRWQSFNPLRDGLNLPALQIIPVWVLLLFIVAYIAVVGPLNFIVLRRFQRVELAWVTVPAIVLLFVLGTYGLSLLVRGNRPITIQFAVVQGFERAAIGQATAFVSVFSPQRREYTLQLPPESLVSKEWNDISRANEAPVVWTEDNTEVRDALIDVSALRSFVVERAVSVPTVTSQVQRDQQRVEVRNTGAAPLLDALIVVDNSSVSLGTLQPGESRVVDLNGLQGAFPDWVDASSTGVFDQQALLRTLFGSRWFDMSFPINPNGTGGEQGIPDRSGIYLLAWQAQAALELDLLGHDEQRESLTLYMIRLDDSL